MPLFGEKPFTSITVKVNQLCTPNRNEDLADDTIEPYLDDLLALIKLQPLGAVETARAIRKKIKYGNTPEELLLALNLLELLVLNAGQKIGRTLASDDKLVDLLRQILSGLARSGLGAGYSASVEKKVRDLAIGWRSEFSDLDGYKPMASLWKLIPKKGLRSRSGLERRDRADPPFEGVRSPPPRPTAASPYGKAAKKKKRSKRYADEQYKIPQINYRVEAPKIRTAIADCYTHTTALDNALIALAPGTSPLDDPKAAGEFERCRKIRRSVLRYLQFVGVGDPSTKSSEVQALDDEFLGSLIVANEQLVATFQKFDAACGYTPANPAPAYDDNESEDSYYTSESDDDVTDELANLHVGESSLRLQEAVAPPPPAPASPLREPVRPLVARVDTNASTESGDPFGDSHAVTRGLSHYY